MTNHWPPKESVRHRGSDLKLRIRLVLLGTGSVHPERIAWHNHGVLRLSVAGSPYIAIARPLCLAFIQQLTDGVPSRAILKLEAVCDLAFVKP